MRITQKNLFLTILLIGLFSINALSDGNDRPIDDAFIKDSLSYGKVGNSVRKDLNIVFTPLHGTSYLLLPKVLNLAGYNNLSIVEDQKTPDGNFPTVKSVSYTHLTLPTKRIV